MSPFSGEAEGVADPFDRRRAGCGAGIDRHDVEARAQSGELRASAQQVACRDDESALLARADWGGGATVVAARARAHSDQQETRPSAHHEIDPAAAAAMIAYDRREPL